MRKSKANELLKNKVFLSYLRNFDELCDNHYDAICDKFEANEVDGFSINSTKVFFTTLQNDGSSWARVMRHQAFIDLVCKEEDSKNLKEFWQVSDEDWQEILKKRNHWLLNKEPDEEKLELSKKEFLNFIL